MKLSEFYSQMYLPEWVMKRNRTGTIRNKTIVFEKYILPMFGERELDSFKKIDWVRFENYLATAKGLKPKTIRNHQGDLRHIMGKAVEWEEIERYPKIDLVPAPAPEPRPEDAKTVRAMLQAIFAEPDHLQALFVMALATGMRIGELRGLQWGDFLQEYDSRTGEPVEVVYIQRSVPGRYNSVDKTKTNAGKRKIPLNEDALRAKNSIYSGQKDFVFVFSSPDKPYEPITYKTCDCAIKRICRRAGVDGVRWHALRHTVASLMLANNVSIYKAKEILGHVDIRTTLRYVKVQGADLLSAVASLDHSK